MTREQKQKIQDTLYKDLLKVKGNYFKLLEQYKGTDKENLFPKTARGLYLAWNSRWNNGCYEGDKAEALNEMVQTYFYSQSEIVSSHRSKNTNKVLRKQNKQILDTTVVLQDILEAIHKTPTIKCKKTRKKVSNKEVSHEWLVSDLHIGKKCYGFDTQTAINRLDEYADYIISKQKLDKPSKTIFVLAGDFIESNIKHADSPDGCDINLSEQVVQASKSLINFFNKVLDKAGIVDIVAVAGNHENPRGKGSAMNFRGNNHLSFVIYEWLRHALQEYNIGWNIPEGVFAVYDWNGNKYICEHGDGTTVNEKSLQNRLDQRSKQINDYHAYFRMGDKHTATIFNGGKLAVNGAFFSDTGGTEFSGVVGYNSDPTQLGFKYIGKEIETSYIKKFS